MLLSADAYSAQGVSLPVVRTDDLGTQITVSILVRFLASLSKKLPRLLARLGGEAIEQVFVAFAQEWESVENAHALCDTLNDGAELGVEVGLVRSNHDAKGGTR